MTNNTSPLATSRPCTKLTEAMYPETRGRISTRSTASKRPVNSSKSEICRDNTVATETAGAGAAALGVAVTPRVQPASCTNMARAKTTVANQKETDWRLIPNSPCSLTHCLFSQPVLMGDIIGCGAPTEHSPHALGKSSPGGGVRLPLLREAGAHHHPETPQRDQHQPCGCDNPDAVAIRVESEYEFA